MSYNAFWHLAYTVGLLLLPLAQCALGKQIHTTETHTQIGCQRLKKEKRPAARF